ncbi:hypothetical protein E1I18_02675 [Mycoplasmopsis mucosicanis]|uniref:Uncharacterized protein n=1 Tax=Mycoplasmopsis mucosicanis TaxID=458208 RepID=A0A507SI62_9BACT|nr:hypothetical protein [Mycoplasmopsis mucosicanis]TQC51400.1 hypothetical protein E1I18_02675 [Mycoplasmopsis mucosicanis]
MKDNQKKNKSLKALLYLTGLPAAALAIVVPLLHSKADIKQNRQDSISTNKLYEALLISENELKNNKRLTPEQRAELESTIKHARQIYDEIIDAHNYDSRSKVSTAIELKNKLYLQIAQFELINAQSDDEFINVANQHDKDFVLEDVKNEYKDLLNKYIDSHTGNGAKKIDKSQFIKSVSDLFEKQNKILFNLELNTDMFIYNKIVTKDFLHIDSKAASMHQIVEFINDQIKSQGISRDAVEVYEELFELKSADLYNDESKNNTINVEKIYSQIQDAKQQVSSLSIEGVEKAKLINELDSLEAFVRKSKGSLDFKVIDQNNKEVSGFKIIEEFINSFWDKTAQYFQDDQKRIEYLKSLIAQAQALIETLPQSLKAQLQSQIEQAQKFIDSKEQKNIFTKVSDFTKEFNSIKIANNVLTSVLNKIAKSNLHADSKKQFSQQLNQIKYTNFFDYVAQINSIEAQINAQSAIKEFFKNKFDELNSQINFSIKYANLLGTSSQDIESLRELQKRIEALNIEEIKRSDLATLFHSSISTVRNINKKELKNVWEKVEIEFKDKSANEILKLKNKFDTFNNKFKQYYSSFSTATRSELSATDKLNNNLNEQFIGGAVAQSLNLWYQAQLANNYTDINEKTLHLQALFDTTFDDDKFKDQENNNDNISSIQLLKKQIEEIRTKGALISNADNLEFSEKLEKLKELSRLQREYEDKLNQIKELDLQRVDADYVFNGYNDNDVAKIYFNKEIRNINRLREEARAALSDPINGNFNLRAIRDELKNALDDFREKLDNKDGESIVALIKSYINNNFANRRKDPSRPTDVEDKLLKAIDKYKGELDKNTRSIKSSTEKSQESQRIQNKMNIVRDAVPAATKFEISLEELIKEHNDSIKSVSNFRDQLNGSGNTAKLSFTPENKTKFETEINNVSKRNTEISGEIEKLQNLIKNELFDSSIHNKSFIQQKEQQIQFLRQELVILNTNLAVQKEFLLMKNNEITDGVLRNSHKICEI